jgi:four helix bundle protein
MKDFRDLQVWEKAHALTLAAYRTTTNFPKTEIYGLTSQIRRCAASVAANIAEGCAKRGNPEFQRFLGIAAASASELEYHHPFGARSDLLDRARLRGTQWGRG